MDATMTAKQAAMDPNITQTGVIRVSSWWTDVHAIARLLSERAPTVAPIASVETEDARRRCMWRRNWLGVS
jgi:hypothetical protein